MWQPARNFDYSAKHARHVKPGRASNMDLNTLSVAVIAIFGAIAVAVIFTFRQRTRIGVQGPGGLRLDVEGSNETPRMAPGVHVEDATSHEGKLHAADATGRGAEVIRVSTRGDIDVSSTPPAAVQDPKVRRRRDQANQQHQSLSVAQPLAVRSSASPSRSKSTSISERHSLLPCSPHSRCWWWWRW
jgi:hypothetical protein